MVTAALNRDQRNLDAVAALLRASRTARHGSIQARQVEVSGGIPLYRAERLGDSEDPLGETRLQGWRYLVFDGDQSVALATVEVEAGHADGPSPATLVNAAAASAEFVARLRLAESAWNESEFELRLIEIPAADAEAIWLAGPNSLFVDLIGPDPQIENAEAFLSRVRETIELRNQPQNIGLDEIGGGPR